MVFVRVSKKIEKVGKWMKEKLDEGHGLNYVQLFYGGVIPKNSLQGEMKITFAVTNRPHYVADITDWPDIEHDAALNFGFYDHRVDTPRAGRSRVSYTQGYSFSMPFIEPSEESMAKVTESKKRALDKMLSRIREFDEWYREAMDGYRGILDDSQRSTDEHAKKMREAAMPFGDREDMRA